MPVFSFDALCPAAYMRVFTGATLPLPAISVPANVFQGILMPIRAVGFLLVAVSCTIHIIPLICCLQVHGVHAALSSACMMIGTGPVSASHCKPSHRQRGEHVLICRQWNIDHSLLCQRPVFRASTRCTERGCGRTSRAHLQSFAHHTAPDCAKAVKNTLERKSP